MATLALEPVDGLSITTLADNYSDMLLVDQGPAKRPPIDVAWEHDDEMVEGRTVDALHAQHGFSVLVTFHRAGREHRILFDAGLSANGVVENMRRLELRLDAIEMVVLSHGHFDHTGGMHGVVRALGRAAFPLVIHPEGWTKRRLSIPGREPLALPTPSRHALEGAGFDIVEEREPSLLLDGSLLMTGEVERTTEFERGFPGHEACRDGRWEPDPLVRDDQALVARVRGKGLVILTGCGHSGIVNVVRHVQRVAGGDPIHAVVGGFHLTGPAFEPIIEPTSEALAAFDADYLVPTHCTGFRAMSVLANRFQDAFVLNSVGTRLEFAAA
jgi:7,8-dihydropterin-6-yl-methyl-4-(beta-D-ribofuranosyl)aminobenzene 5'-phosphate synthase